MANDHDKNTGETHKHVNDARLFSLVLMNISAVLMHTSFPQEFRHKLNSVICYPVMKDHDESLGFNS